MEKTNPLIPDIRKLSASDDYLAGLLDEARECAQVYLMAKQTYKGFENMGEVATLEEELKIATDKMIIYYLEKRGLTGSCEYDVDSMAIRLSVNE
jgi:hypothetical protein